MIIDVHSHVCTPELLDHLAAHSGYGLKVEKDGKGGYTLMGHAIHPGLWDLEVRLASLEARGVDLQLVGTLNTLLNWPGGAPDSEQARHINVETARAEAAAGGRLAGMATIAFGEPDKAAEYLRGAIGEHGFKGAHLGIAAGALGLDDPVFEDLWGVAEEFGLFLYMHPARDRTYERYADYSLATVILYPTETCITVSRMIFAGVFERHPGLNLCLAHGGGTLPYLAARLDRAYDARVYEHNPALYVHISEPPSAYIKRLSVDTCVFGREQLAFLAELMGTERMMFGTDYPFEIGDAEGELAMPYINSLGTDDRDRIQGDNAKAILDAARAP